MGTKLLTITLGSLVVIWFIDFFTVWYAKFLKRWMPNIKLRELLGQLVWAILALIFWNILYRNHLPETFSPTYFFFVLFIYSVRGLVHSLIKGRAQKSMEG
ncbi:MAG: hypothetical protein ACE5NG_05495 [bacterium]